MLFYKTSDLRAGGSQAARMVPLLGIGCNIWQTNPRQMTTSYSDDYSANGSFLLFIHFPRARAAAPPSLPSSVAFHVREARRRVSD